MGLNLKIPAEFSLSSGNDRRLVLPEIFLQPTPENMPFIARCQVDVEGSSTQMHQGEVYQIAERLRGGYQRLDYRTGKEVPLRQQLKLPMLPVVVDGPIPADARFVLTVQVWYYDSDSLGRANVSAGLKGPVKGTMILTPAHAAMVYPSGAPAGPCRIEVDPTHLQLVDRGDPRTLTVRIAGRPQGVAPRLALVDPLADAPALRAALAAALSLEVTAASPEDGWEVWHAALALELEPEARRLLWERSQGGPFEVAARAEVGKTTCELTLRLLCQEDIFKGLIAIDFGTSNSTVTLYDPGVVEDLTGLAPEQEARLKELLLTELMGEDGSCKLAGTDEQSWRALIERVGGNLAGDGPPAERFRGALRAGGGRMFEAVRQLEICLGARPIRAAVFRALNRIYHEAFLEPRLKSQSLTAVPLDPNFPQEKDVPSEMEVQAPSHSKRSSVESRHPADSPFRVVMGRRAKQDRQQAMALAGPDGSAAPAGDKAPPSLDAIGKLFHHSPKRYLGVRKTFHVPLGGEPVAVTSDQLVQAAWAQLVDLTDEWRRRNPTACSKGRFTRAVVTYPTVSPPSVRREVDSLVHELKFPDVVTDYDEAVAAALFYLHREFGGSLDLGPEVFKARSRRDKNKWFQNVLVLDIGGGSTDLALLQLTLEEVDPFLPGENRGAGGRCYLISPRLLGSSGNTQLGGELITLRVFRLLKAALADKLLVAVQEKDVDSAALAAKIGNLPLAFVDESGKYRPGSIPDAVIELPESDPRFSEALNAAELVLPTRWRNATSRLQVFYSLWEQAEAAKIQLGARRAPGAEPPVFELNEQDVTTLLNQCGIAHSVQEAGTLRVSLDAGQFERVAEPVIQEAVGIARGLLAGRLPRHEPAPGTPPTDGDDAPQEPLDWLILSGKTCNLDLVQRVIRQELATSPHFVWNTERVTFVPQYAKLAPSAGACYAEKMRRTAFAPARFKEQLRKGLNQLTYNIDNLFFFLPCSFLVPVHNGQIEIFKAGQPLYRLDEQEIGKARSEPLGVRLLNAVMRRDFQSATPILWGSYDGMALARELQMTVPVFLNRIMMQFEVDYRLFLRIFLWDGPMPHYQIDSQAAFIDVAEGFRKPAPQQGTAAKAEGAPPKTTEVPRAGNDISVDVITAQTNNRPATVLIAAGQELHETFHFTGDGQGRGVIATLPDLFDETGRLAVHARLPGSAEWSLVGELRRPVDPRPPQPGQERVTEYPRRYRVTLDEHGVLRVHLGEVPYWKTEDLEEWKRSPGRVLQRDLELVEPPPRENRDPFCGAH
jgi:hypothetical protein